MQAYPEAMDGKTPPQRKHKEFQMTTANIISVVDRFALSLLNGIALIGVPLIAIGVLTQTL